MLCNISGHLIFAGAYMNMMPAVCTYLICSLGISLYFSAVNVMSLSGLHQHCDSALAFDCLELPNKSWISLPIIKLYSRLISFDFLLYLQLLVHRVQLHQIRFLLESHICYRLMLTDFYHNLFKLVLITCTATQ